jgi:hypothetical protein
MVSTVPYNRMGLQGKGICRNFMYVQELPEELPGNAFNAPEMVAFRQAGEIGTVGESLAKNGETPIGAIK